MATQAETIDRLLGILDGIGDLRSRKMFGEYALYCDEKVVAFVCDDQLFVKPNPASGPFEERCQEAPPYPGAKMYLQVPEEEWHDRDWLRSFIRASADALPLPKPKTKR